MEKNVFEMIVESILNRSRIKYSKKVHEKGSIYFTFYGFKYPRVIRVSDHSVPMNRQWTKCPDYNILNYEDLCHFTNSLKRLTPG